LFVYRIALIVSESTLQSLGEELKARVGVEWSFWPIGIDQPIYEIFEQLRAWEVSGIICEHRPDLTEVLSSLNKPMVTVLADLLIGGSVCVNVDDYEVGRVAAKYLHQKGLRSFASIGREELHSQEKV